MPGCSSSGEARRILKRIPIFYAAMIGTLALGVWNAVRLRWVCDDAFITFRYVDNLIAGNGVVYNVGERVEGYTHFLWLLLIALCRRFGADPVVAAEWLGIASFVLTLGVFAFISRRYGGRPVILPLTALILAAHFDAAIWATGGLETSLFTLLVALSFVLAGVWRSPSPARPLLTGVVLALVVMTRPDGAVFLAVAIAASCAEVAIERRSRGAVLRRGLWIAVPVVLLLAPWLVWKLAYYGSLLPNTYYAKSAGSAYFQKGLAYIWLYCRAYISVLLLIPALVWLLVARLLGKGRLADREGRVLILALAYLLAYALLFVARVGGDFMYARFLIPVVPYAYLAIEILLRRITGGRVWILAAVLLLLPLQVAHERARRDALFADREGNREDDLAPAGVTDEHWFYTHREGGTTLIEAYRVIGERLATYFQGTDARVILGGQACLGYYGRFAVCIERWGLTDPYIARLPVEKRARVGHEKSAPWDYLIRRGVEFEFLKRPINADPFRPVYFRVAGDTIRGELITYNRALMRHLAERFPNDVRFVDFDAYLDGWLRAMPGMPPDAVRRDYADFKEFYFLHNPDPAREGRILAYLGAHSGR